MSRTSFRIAFDGPALSEGAMDVQDLAPALLALGSLAERANIVLNGEKARARVVVRARFRKGSFEINLEFVQTLFSQALLAFGAGGLASGANVLQYLGFVKNEGHSFLRTMLALRGRKVKRTLQLENGGVRFELDEGTVDAPREIAVLMRDDEVMIHTRRMLRPLESDGIGVFKALDGDRNTVTKVTKKELPFFSLPQSPVPPLPAATAIPLPTQNLKLAFRLGTVTFDGPKWKLWLGESQVSVNIQDESFLEKIRTNEEQFAHDDVLLCDVTIQQTHAGAEIKTEHTITRVLEHSRSWKQMALPVGAPP
jgi:hypothetical protein